MDDNQYRESLQYKTILSPGINVFFFVHSEVSFNDIAYKYRIGVGEYTHSGKKGKRPLKSSLYDRDDDNVRFGPIRKRGSSFFAYETNIEGRYERSLRERALYTNGYSLRSII